ncbi:MAG: amidohydrolase family protein [Dehalococcoidia bacterium]
MDYLKISADDHIDLGYLPKDLWTSRLPKALLEQAPQVEDRGERGEFWVCGGETWGEYRGERFFSRPNRNPLALDRGGVGEEGRPTTASKRLEDLDRDRVEASMMFPPIIALQVGDGGLRNACVQAYNDWAADFAAQAPKRLMSVGMLSPVDPAGARDEVVRLAKDGRIKEVSFLVNDVTTEMYLESWDPFWDAAEETGMIVSYHVGGSLKSGSFRSRMAEFENSTSSRRPAFDMGLGNGGNAFFEPFVNLFTFGTLERHPNLKFVLAESGTGWIPYVVQEMDYRFNRLFETRKDVPLKQLPSDIFKRQVWATYQSDLVGLHLTQFFGDGHMMWASDYPHHDSTWPFSQEIVEKETAHLPPDQTKKIVRDNAAALYGL